MLPAVDSQHLAGDALRASQEQHGIGLLMAKEAGLVDNVKSLIDRLREEANFFLSDRLREEILKLAGEI